MKKDYETYSRKFKVGDVVCVDPTVFCDENEHLNHVGVVKEVDAAKEVDGCGKFNYYCYVEFSTRDSGLWFNEAGLEFFKSELEPFKAERSDDFVERALDYVTSRSKEEFNEWLEGELKTTVSVLIDFEDYEGAAKGIQLLQELKGRG